MHHISEYFENVGRFLPPALCLPDQPGAGGQGGLCPGVLLWGQGGGAEPPAGPPLPPPGLPPGAGGEGGLPAPPPHRHHAAGGQTSGRGGGEGEAGGH